MAALSALLLTFAGAPSLAQTATEEPDADAATEPATEAAGDESVDPEEGPPSEDEIDRTEGAEGDATNVDPVEDVATEQPTDDSTEEVQSDEEAQSGEDSSDRFPLGQLLGAVQGEQAGPNVLTMSLFEFLISAFPTDVQVDDDTITIEIDTSTTRGGAFTRPDDGGMTDSGMTDTGEDATSTEDPDSITDIAPETDEDMTVPPEDVDPLTEGDQDLGESAQGDGDSDDADTDDMDNDSDTDSDS